VAAVLGNVLGVSSFSTTISSPTAKFFGQRTMRDAMQGAQYELHSTLHRTVVHTETCEIEVLRDTASGEATLLLTAAELGAEHAKAVAKGFEVAHTGSPPTTTGVAADLGWFANPGALFDELRREAAWRRRRNDEQADGTHDAPHTALYTA